MPGERSVRQFVAFMPTSVPSMSRVRNLAELNPQRICVVKPSAFGCVVQALPLIDALRRRYPAASISWVIRDDLHELLKGHPDLAECLVYRRRRGPGAFLHLLRQLRSREFDVAIDLQGLMRSGAMTLATRAPVRIGLESAREGSALACNTIVSGTGRGVPAVDRYWRVAEALGCGTGPRRTDIVVPKCDLDWAQGLLNVLPRPRIAVHAGAMWETKRCPPDLFAAILNRATAQFGGSILLVGSDDEAAAAARVQALLQPPRSGRIPVANLSHALSDRGGAGSDGVSANLIGSTNLKQLAALLSGVDVLLCNDSGPMHLAAAMGTPVVGLFTCTSPRLSGPQGNEHHLLSADVPCAAGYHKSCPLSGDRHLRCHRAMPLEDVSNALNQVLTLAGKSRAGQPANRPAVVDGTPGARDPRVPATSGSVRAAEQRAAARYHAQSSFEQGSSCSMHCSQ